jgi:hypothetical protein
MGRGTYARVMPVAHAAGTIGHPRCRVLRNSDTQQQRRPLPTAAASPRAVQPLPAAEIPACTPLCSRRHVPRPPCVRLMLLLRHVRTRTGGPCAADLISSNFQYYSRAPIVEARVKRCVSQYLCLQFGTRVCCQKRRLEDQYCKRRRSLRGRTRRSNSMASGCRYQPAHEQSDPRARADTSNRLPALNP